MARAVISYGSYTFTTTGRAQYGRRDTYESDAPGARPQIRRTVWTVDQVFKEPTFGDNAARYAALLTALKTTEAIFSIIDENGTPVVSLRARPIDGDWPSAWQQHMAECKVSFATIEDLAATADPFAATYTPTGGSAVSLPNVSGFKVETRTERASAAAPNRRETNCVVSLSGKIRANPQSTPADRRTYLLAQRAAIEGLDSKDGRLVFSSFDKTVRVDMAVADLRDATEELAYSLTLSYRRFPSGDYAECEYTFAQADDLTTRERMTTVKGKVRADDEPGAQAKADDIRELCEATGRVLRKSSFEAQRMDGGDGAAFTEGSFTYEFREVLPGAASYTLAIATKDDLKTGKVQISYSGTATGEDTAAALAAARAAGDGKHDLRLTSTETVETFSVEGGDEQLVRVAFAYEYLTKGALYWAEVTVETHRATFGASLKVITGYATADTEAHALTLAQSFKDGALLLRDARETPGSEYRGISGGQVAQFSRTSFSYTYHLAAASGSLSYAKKTVENRETREITTTWSGTAWAANESTADGLIDTLVAGETGRPGPDDRTSGFDKSGATVAFLSRSFSITFIAPLAAGDDTILAAEVAVESTYTVDHAVLTPIPFGSVHVQTGCGETPGLRVVSGSVTALTLADAQDWARALEPSGHALPPREKETTVYYPLSGTEVKCLRLDFTYSAAFASLVR